MRCYEAGTPRASLDKRRIIAIGLSVIVPKEKATASEPVLLSPRHDAGTRQTSTHDITIAQRLIAASGPV